LPNDTILATENATAITEPIFLKELAMPLLDVSALLFAVLKPLSNSFVFNFKEAHTSKAFI
jgi:hypothetical protein